MDSHSPEIERVSDFAERVLTAATPGTYLVEYFTWMAYLPRWMTPWRRYAEHCFAKDTEMFEQMLDKVRERFVSLKFDCLYCSLRGS